MLELNAGVAWWPTTWPADFHNAAYRRLSDENPGGDFTLNWWGPFLNRLNRWHATRNGGGDAVLTDRFVESIDELREAWHVSCEPHVEHDISEVRWDQISAFPASVATIKRTKSPVFTSKFCHFLLPKVFPVVDRAALGNGWRTYESYFRYVQNEWGATESHIRAELIDHLSGLITKTGEQVFAGFPLITKIVELRLIGRRHPS